MYLVVCIPFSRPATNRLARYYLLLPTGCWFDLRVTLALCLERRSIVLPQLPLYLFTHVPRRIVPYYHHLP